MSLSMVFSDAKFMKSSNWAGSSSANAMNEGVVCVGIEATSSKALISGIVIRFVYSKIFIALTKCSDKGDVFNFSNLRVDWRCVSEWKGAGDGFSGSRCMRLISGYGALFFKRG